MTGDLALTDDQKTDVVEINFVDKILDNVHGFISYTEAEKKIIELPVFRRLQSIKQLSVANWIFPGSEHTRYIHSLGVMHIADKIAIQLDLSPEDRKIIRLAGLLHDIGHYPLSHVCEVSYKNGIEEIHDSSFFEEYNLSVIEKIDSFEIKKETEYMKTSKRGHHEFIGALVIKDNKDICAIIAEECNYNDHALDIICDMITGNVEREGITDPLFVQILHSELDADGIDYMMRDAMFSGTSFGAFELEQIIRNLEIGETKGKKRILCIKPKAIAAADQYLINKYFSYSQVVFNKHISVLELMAEQIVNWMQQKNKDFPDIDTLCSWIENAGDNDKFLNFTDTFYWEQLRKFSSNQYNKTFPAYIKMFCEKLMKHDELQFIDEVKISSNDKTEIIEKLQGSSIYTSVKNNSKDSILLLSCRPLNKNIPYKDYTDAYNQKPKITNTELGQSEEKEQKRTHDDNRLMEGICVKEKDEMHLLCDDERSLMRQLSGTNLVILRQYKTA